MTKTASEIEQDLYDLVVVSTLPSSVNGKLYKKGTRPTDSKVEDIIVGFIAGLDSEISRGTVFVNIYVPQILVGGTHIKDIKRTSEVERLLRNFFDTLKGGEYRFSLDGTIQPYEDTNTKQDIVSMRMRYKVFTQN
jgi:hypothetical protein